jgi:hypothetical protein
LYGLTLSVKASASRSTYGVVNSIAAVVPRAGVAQAVPVEPGQLDVGLRSLLGASSGSTFGWADPWTNDGMGQWWVAISPAGSVSATAEKPPRAVTPMAPIVMMT